MVGGERVEGGVGEGRVVVVGEVEEVFNEEVVSGGGVGGGGSDVVGGELRVEGVLEELLSFHGFVVVVEGGLKENYGEGEVRKYREFKTQSVTKLWF